jgi:formylglycine-generating enzyme required for sulfatase activity
VLERFAFTRGRWSLSVFVLLVIAACGSGGGMSPPFIAAGTSGGGFAGGSVGSASGAAANDTLVSGSGNPQSCAPGGPGMTNCGAGGSGTESCCASLEVTGGTYYRAYDAPQPEDAGAFADAAFAAEVGPTGGSDPATVSSFRLDKYDVTVGRFRQFVNAWSGGWFAEAGAGKHAHLNQGLGLVNVEGGYEPGWVATDDSKVVPTNANLTSCSPYSTWTASAGTQENLPINCVNWPEAYAFCVWDGGFLPSEAEWEYAAAGGSQQRLYPWGQTAPGTGNQYAVYGCYYPNGLLGDGGTSNFDGGGFCVPGTSNIAPVGTATLGAGLWGQLDLAGNLWEWNLDVSTSYVYPCTDCANLTVTPIYAERLLRGGFFGSNVSDLVPSSGGNEAAPTDRFNNNGFRCARTP